MKKRSPTTKAIGLLHQLYGNGQLLLAPEFQRSSVWPNAAKAYLIDTILNDRPIPLIFLQREATKTGRPFAAGLDSSCVEALKAVGLGTPRSLSEMLRSNRFRYASRTFASSRGLGPAEVSHLASVVLAAILKDAKVVHHHFPEIISDPAIQQFYERRAGKGTTRQIAA
jgi:hypothetical protein